MKAAIIAIGDELVCGQRVDTNSAWLSLRLGELGIPVVRHLTAPDELEDCRQTLQQAAEVADILVVTGGLGPTQDDITREAVAAMADTDLALHEPSREHIMQIFAARGRPMPPSNLRQAMLPRRAPVIANPHGTAPGIDLRLQAPPIRLFALPGVPAEMHEMWEASVKPALIALQDEPHAASSSRVIMHRVLNCFGLGESALEEQIFEFLKRGRQPSIGITAHRATISLRLSAAGATADQCLAALDRDIHQIRQRLGNRVFGEGDERMEDAVIQSIASMDAVLATSERATRGLLARWLSAADSAGGYAGGAVTQSAAPRSMSTLDACRQEASRVRAEYQSDSVIVVGGLVEADQGLEVPLLAQFRQLESAQMLPWSGHPDIREERTAKQALDLLRHLLLSA